MNFKLSVRYRHHKSVNKSLTERFLLSKNQFLNFSEFRKLITESFFLRVYLAINGFCLFYMYLLIKVTVYTYNYEQKTRLLAPV